MTLLVGVSTFVWTILSIWQGLDFTDMGYWLTSYDQFYSNPDVIVFSCWLSCFVGHWCGVLLGGGVLSYKFGYVVVVTATCVVTFRFLCEIFTKSWALALFVILTAAFSKVLLGNWLDYNNLTALFYVVGCYLLLTGLIRKQTLRIVLAGAVLGANAFIRFPNIVGISMLLGVFYHSWQSKQGLRRSLNQSCLFISGFVLGVASIAVVVVAAGHQDLFVRGIQEMFLESRSAGSSHSLSGMLKVLLRDHYKAMGLALPIAVFGGWACSWLSREKNWAVLLVAVAVGPLFLYKTYFQGAWVWIVPGLCYLTLFASTVCERKENSALRCGAFISGLMLFLVPLGSNNGLQNFVFGMWLALPFALMWILTIPAIKIGEFAMSGMGRIVLVASLAAILCIQALEAAWSQTYRDSDDRTTMTHGFDHPLLAGVYTTPERAKAVSELLKALSVIAPGEADLLGYNKIPLVHFLTAKHPWLGMSCPEWSDPKVFERRLISKELSNSVMPVVVRAVYATEEPNWPRVKAPLWTSPQREAIQICLGKFLKRHNYSVVWKNSFFEVLAPQRGKLEETRAAFKASP